jgi:hypothetical protein
MVELFLSKTRKQTGKVRICGCYVDKAALPLFRSCLQKNPMLNILLLADSCNAL